MIPTVAPIAGLILDLDGTVYRGAEEVPGAAEFVRYLQGHSLPYLFVTNRANRPPEEVDAQLKSYGIPSSPDRIMTSAQATAAQIANRRIYCIGEAGIVAELEKTGNVITEDRPDTVIVSFDRQFTYDKLVLASRFISRGARFIATNPDKALDTNEGPRPGTGALIAAIECVTGRSPEIIGKPQPTIMLEAARKMNLAPTDIVAIGDNLDTDIPAGHSAGMRTVWITTGISKPGLPQTVQPTWIVNTYKELTNIVASCNEYPV